MSLISSTLKVAASLFWTGGGEGVRGMIPMAWSAATHVSLHALDMVPRPLTARTVTEDNVGRWIWLPYRSSGFIHSWRDAVCVLSSGESVSILDKEYCLWTNRTYSTLCAMARTFSAFSETSSCDSSGSWTRMESSLNCLLWLSTTFTVPSSFALPISLGLIWPSLT